MLDFSLAILTQPEQFVNFKHSLKDATGLAEDALHIYTGLGLWLLFSVLLGRQRWSRLTAWILVGAITLWGEWMDLRQASFAQVGSDDAGWHDIWNTMLMPTILLLLGRWIFAPRGKAQSAPETDDGLSDSADERLE